MGQFGPASFSSSRNTRTVEAVEDLGPGIIIDTQGDILTALHVVQGASRIKVTFFDGVISTASITSSDPTHDIAVLSTQRLPPVDGAGSARVVPQVGDQVYAVGNPLGLVGSLSAGVVSGLDRTFTLGNGRTFGDDPVRRRSQPGQLGRPPTKRKRTGDRDRDRTRQPSRDR